MFAHHTPDRWKALRLTEITQAMIVQRHRDITASGGSRRANYWLAMMSRLFTLGMGQGHCTLNPCTGIKKNAETHRDRYLSERELATLWNYLERSTNVEAAACVQFILLTGCRPGEAYTMRWATSTARPACGESRA